MKIIAKTPVQLGGHIYERGEECEYGGAVTARIAANFTDETGRALTVGAKDGAGAPNPGGGKGAKDGAGAANLGGEGEKTGQSPEPQGTQTGGAQGELFDANDVQARIDKTIQVLGRQGIMQALEDMGITYQANASNKHLAKLLLTSQGEIKAED